jgi:transmembrane sensor
MVQEAGPEISISEQAARWWVIFNEPNAQPAEHREFAEWVARSPERVEGYLRMARLHQTLRCAEVRWPTISAEELIHAAKASTADVRQFPSRAVRERTARPGMWLKVAACVLLACGSAWFLSNRPQQFQTKFGEQTSVTLADGSRITLNTASKVEVDLRRDGRRIRLLEGEALFEVSHDPKRPFDVHVGDVTLRAVGTQFDVDLRSSSTTVTVVEGRVAVDAGARAGVGSATDVGPDARHQVLGAADRLVISRSIPGTTQHGINVAAALSWTQHQLVFEKRPLEEVAAEFNRYNRRHIVIDDADLRRQEVTGVFQSNDPDSFISFLSGIPGVQIRDNGQGGAVISLESRTAPSK